MKLIFLKYWNHSVRFSYMRVLLNTCIIVLIALCVSCAGKSEYNEGKEASDTVAVATAGTDDFDSAKVKDETKPAEDELPERYVASSSNEAIELMNSLPEAELYRQGILPKMSQECLKYAMRLLNEAHDGFLIVDKDAMKVVLYDRYGRERLRYGIACGKGYGTKHAKGDSRTPEGFFSVQGIYDSTDWLFRDDNGKVSKVKGQFGPRFIRLSIPGTSQIGIHGTRAPWSIGARCSHGCIRVTNDNIMELVKHVKPGMPVIVSPSRKDERVNIREGYNIPWVSVHHTTGRKSIDPSTVKQESPQNETPEPKAAADTVVALPEPLPADTVAVIAE